MGKNKRNRTTSESFVFKEISGRARATWDQILKGVVNAGNSAGTPYEANRVATTRSVSPPPPNAWRLQVHPGAGMGHMRYSSKIRPKSSKSASRGGTPSTRTRRDFQRKPIIGQVAPALDHATMPGRIACAIVRPGGYGGACPGNDARDRLDN